MGKNDKKQDKLKYGNLYDLLYVRPDAPQEVIEAAHNAIENNNIGKDGEKSNLNYKIKVGMAKEILCDPKKRKEFDDEYFKKTNQTIGNYKIIEPIATGGFATTYKAEHMLTKAPACIKYNPKLSPLEQETLVKECEVLWDLRHHAIPAMRDLIKQDDGSIALVMSYIPGQTLDKYVEKTGGLDPEHVCWITQRVLDGLRFLHYHGVVHGDVNPKNILIQPEHHTVCLVDYGLAALKPKATDKAAGHTPYFSPPEQIKGKALLPESDFYSLGMTMIHALGGDIINKRVTENVPDSLCDFIGDMITQDIEGRPNWEDEDLIQKMLKVRQESFGRTRSSMLKLPKI